jgi:hypothetical protein
MFAKVNLRKHFKYKTLPINFSNGHQEYYEKWRYLFFYEVFNILINSRRSTEREDEFADQQNKANRGNSFVKRGKVMYSKAFGVVGITQGEFTTLRLYEEPPHGLMVSKSKDNSKKQGIYFK